MPFADPAKNDAAKRAYEARRKREDPIEYNKQRVLISRRYQMNNPEKVKAANKRYKIAHPDYIMVWQAKDRARRNNLPFDLRIGDIEIPTHCPVLGIELKPGLAKWAASSPSLDRIKPELGYVKSNVRVISWRANNLKRDGTLEEFEKLVAYIKENS